MPRGRLSYPGPGLFPMIVGVFLIATALGCLIQEILPRKKTARARRLRPSRTAIQQPRRAATYSKTFQLMALMIGYTLALKPLGFLVCHRRLSGGRDPHLRLPPVGSRPGNGGHHRGHLLRLFVLWLKVPLPLGILEEVLG